MEYDLLIIGSGPAGLTAAIYAQRAGLKALTLEKSFMSGGQMMDTFQIDNYPGMPKVSGTDLAMAMRSHAEGLGAEFKSTEVTGLDLAGEMKSVTTDDGTYTAPCVILAMGAKHRKAGVPGEDRLAGMGVSYCATCDGAFFRGSDVAVIGGGDTAVGDALFLARGCRKVYVVHRRDELRAAKSLQDALFALDNVEMVWSSVVDSIEGENQTGAVRLHSVKDGTERSLHIDGVFIAVGSQPETALVKDQLELDAAGYIKADETCRTSLPGVFAAGDIRTKQLRQIVAACADGAAAVDSAQSYLSEVKAAAK